MSKLVVFGYRLTLPAGDAGAATAMVAVAPSSEVAPYEHD
jgi:hypothetical protein